MEQKPIVMRISSEMLEEIMQYQKTLSENTELTSSTPSFYVKKTVFIAIVWCINHTKKHRKLTSCDIVDIEKKDKRKKDCRISIRLTKEEQQLLLKFYNVTKISVAIRCAILDVVQQNERPHEMDGSEKVRYLLGQKNLTMTEWLSSIFDTVIKQFNVTTYAEPFTGTANVYLHSHINLKTILNDNNKWGCNLLKVIRDYPKELKLELFKQPITATAFKDAVTKLKKLSLNTKAERIEAACLYFFITNCSYYGKAENYNKTEAPAFQKKLDSLSIISERLQNVEITNCDALYFLDKLQTACSHLLYFDPPYICSEEYYAKQNTREKIFFSHIALRNRIDKLRKNNVCIISYRITTSKTMKSKGFDNNFVCNALDKLYLDRGFFIAFKKLATTKRQIEILISSVSFDGSIAYDTPLHQMDINSLLS